MAASPSILCFLYTLINTTVVFFVLYSLFTRINNNWQTVNLRTFIAHENQVIKQSKCIARAVIIDKQSAKAKPIYVAKQVKAHFLFFACVALIKFMFFFIAFIRKFYDER